MPVFAWEGRTRQGQVKKGVIEAASQKTARLRLKQKGVMTTEISERSAKAGAKGDKRATGKGTSGSVNHKNVTMMTRQLATLIKARIPLDEALAALIEQTDDNKLKSILSNVRESVNEGKSLAESCKRFPKVFTPIFTAMISVGEASGNLDLVLNRLTAFHETQQGLRSKGF